jgi:hypothetical protein
MVRHRIAFEGTLMSLNAPRNLAIGLKREQKLVEPIGFESASCMEIKELCGATWPSKVLKGKERNS